jgi:hypothetical protein
MTTEQQMTFGPVVAMEPVVPTRLHPDDSVECADGTVIPLRDAFTDCRGGYHCTDEQRRESNVAIVREVLDAHLAWATEYARENEDFADGYACILREGSHAWPDRIEEWIYSTYDDGDKKAILIENEDEFDFEATPETADETAYEFSDFVDDNLCVVSDEKLAQAIMDDIDDSDACDVEFGGNEWGSYDGPGCCLDGFDIGEQEEQVDVNAIPEFAELHACNELDDCLDEYDGDASVCRSRRREKNEETGYYEYVGRETYMPYEHHAKYPTFEFYHSPGGRWDFVVPADRMEELFEDALERLSGKEVS